MPSHVATLTDSEVAVMYDSLVQMRTFIRETRPDIANSYGTPNLDTALQKIGGLIGPATAMLYVTTHEGMEAIKTAAFAEGVAKERERFTRLLDY